MVGVGRNQRDVAGAVVENDVAGGIGAGRGIRSAEIDRRTLWAGGAGGSGWAGCSRGTLRSGCASGSGWAGCSCRSGGSRRALLREQTPLAGADVRLMAGVAGDERNVAGAIVVNRVANRVGCRAGVGSAEINRRTLRTCRSGRAGGSSWTGCTGGTSGACRSSGALCAGCAGSSC